MPEDQNLTNSAQNAQTQGQIAGSQGAAGSQAQGGSQLLAYQDHEISADLQAMVNKPADHAEALDPKDVEFLKMLMAKIDAGEINLYRPSTLLNFPIYEKLSELAQGKADVEAFNLLGTIREIRTLWNLGHHNTYQIENLTHRIRVTKERLEDAGGDIYII